jgi:hypothetical protein
MEEQIKDNDVPIVDLEKLVEEGELKELDFSLLSIFSNQEFEYSERILHLVLVIKNTPKEYSGILNTIFSNQEYYRVISLGYS